MREYKEPGRREPGCSEGLRVGEAVLAGSDMMNWPKGAWRRLCLPMTVGFKNNFLQYFRDITEVLPFPKHEATSSSFVCSFVYSSIYSAQMGHVAAGPRVRTMQGSGGSKPSRPAHALSDPATSKGRQMIVK